MAALRLVLRLFSKISGLEINFSKSCFVPINMNVQQIGMVRQILGCRKEEFPVSYLGMPLTVLKPSRHQFLPLIEKLEKRLQGWKQKLLSRGGRFQLVKSVLSTIPIYYMQCFLLPNWVINKVDRLRRLFLWGKNKSNERGLSLINWGLICTPIEWGGMGMTNLKIQNMALLLRWWWRAHHDQNSLWTSILNRLRRRNQALLWFVTGSFFWRQLQSIQHIFHMSTTWEIGDGCLISFWFHAWSGLPIRENRAPRPQQPYISLQQGLPLCQVIAPDSMTQASSIVLSSAQDRIIWRWSVHGLYMAKSIYTKMMEVGMIKDECSKVSRYKVPQTVRMFAYLLFKGRILTRDVLQRRGIPCQIDCVLCTRNAQETASHLLFECTYTAQLWNE